MNILEELRIKEQILSPLELNLVAEPIAEIPQLDGNQEVHSSSLLDEPYEPPPSSTCKTCKMSFRDLDWFTEHNAYEYCCSICEICFQTKEDVIEHEEEFHPVYPGVKLRQL